MESMAGDPVLPVLTTRPDLSQVLARLAQVMSA
jgi:hypothetical protein